MKLFSSQSFFTTLTISSGVEFWVKFPKDFPDTFKLTFVDFKGESTSTRQFVAQTYKLKEKNPEYYNFLIKEDGLKLIPK